MTTVTEFNQTALEFLTRMMEAFPQEPKIKAYYHKFNLVKGANTKKPVEMFMENRHLYDEFSRNCRNYVQDQHMTPSILHMYTELLLDVLES